MSIKSYYYTSMWAVGSGYMVYRYTITRCMVGSAAEGELVGYAVS